MTLPQKMQPIREASTGQGALIQVEVPQDAQKETGDLIERLMGKKPELRFKFIQENAQFAAAGVDV